MAKLKKFRRGGKTSQWKILQDGGDSTTIARLKNLPSQKTERLYDKNKYELKHQQGGIVDPRGQWAHPGNVTIIPSNNITMEGVDYPVLGVSDTGHTQMMQPGGRYKFKGKSVTEYPIVQNGGFTDPRTDNYYTPSSSDKKWSIEQDKTRNIGKTVMLPEVNITAPRAQYPSELGKRLQYSRDESQKLKDATAEERWTNSYKGEQGLGNDIIGEQIGFGVLAKSLSSIKPIASELTGIGKNAIQNTWKLNPYASKLGMYNRVVGEDAILDMQKTGLIRTGENAGVSSGSGFRQTPYPSFGKGNPGQTYVNQVIEQGKTPHIISTNRPMGVSTLGRHGKGSTMFPIGEDYVHGSKNYLREFPATEAKVFEGKPHWLKGYPEVKQPTSSFKSEIDWSKWNSEIPANQSLMKEYNIIEQTSKANGTWMKNPDGSPFQGTPEQFVQQNSENFKKSFGNSIVRDDKGNLIIMRHGSPQDNIQELLPPKYNQNWKEGRTATDKNTTYNFLTPKKEIAEKYSRKDLLGYHTGDNLSLYVNSEKPLFTNDYIELANPDQYINNHNNYDIITNMKFGKDFNPKDYSEIALPFKNKAKSAIGNNGMFDMTNPNIYKGLAPIGIGAGLVSQQEKAFGGNVKSQWKILN